MWHPKARDFHVLGCWISPVRWFCARSVTESGAEAHRNQALALCENGHDIVNAHCAHSVAARAIHIARVVSPRGHDFVRTHCAHCVAAAPHCHSALHANLEGGHDPGMVYDFS